MQSEEKLTWKEDLGAAERGLESYGLLPLCIASPTRRTWIDRLKMRFVLVISIDRDISVTYPTVNPHLLNFGVLRYPGQARLNGLIKQNASDAGQYGLTRIGCRLRIANPF
ncbi:hypothetical protein CKAN_01519100 [Cinnamomum micranthum f. kanehirae]|uniref:Uncharacterized protein n=1 Tax=Cinnamomum micranthum f. kanehirae TaxID=337451 RepID=A0A3S3N153_9MAGN|nr:hypothetical protein CKAN_01519100 [Cinnamomum micranthum f. kanehirae]